MVKRVFKLFFDFEKEEAWLNDMARHGWMMDSFFLGVYQFSEGPPEEYVYRIELLPQAAASAGSRPYLRFLEETGAEVVSTWFRWAYYRKKACDGDFEIYTDIGSRIGHYKRVACFMYPVCVLEWCMALIQGINFFMALADPYGVHVPAGFSLFFFMFGLLAGIGIFRAARRSQLQYRRLEREKIIQE
ncbi:MAG: DUF2812 domain-containing protein [Firmicutes bacterium]|nr:DUF2812 domain-containing protein [Bacillota bacterium]